VIKTGNQNGKPLLVIHGGNYTTPYELIKLMCVAPQTVEKSVLVVPAGFANASIFRLMMSAGIPMILYAITKKEKWLKKVILPAAVEEKNIDDATLEMFKYSLEHVAVKNHIPTIVNAGDLRRYTAPTFIIVSEYDRVFPADKTLAKAKEVIQNLKTHILKGQGQKFFLSDVDIDMIVRFINE